jgi:hypothetical protein
VVIWGKIDDHMEALRAALIKQPKCQNMPAYDGAAFMRRLNHFEALSNRNFESSKVLLSFIRRTCNEIRSIKPERDIVVHGSYDFSLQIASPEENFLLIWEQLGTPVWQQPGPPARARKYSLAEFQELTDRVSRVSARIIRLGDPPVLYEGVDPQWRGWGIPRHRVAEIETLLRPIQDPAFVPIAHGLFDNSPTATPIVPD